MDRVLTPAEYTAARETLRRWDNPGRAEAAAALESHKRARLAELAKAPRCCVGSRWEHAAHFPCPV
jgi:hypothetical protein